MSLTFTADFGELNAYLERLIAKDAEVKPVLFEVVLNVANQLDQRIDGEMPVDTGRARAGWGKYNPELLAEGALKVVDSIASHITRPSKRTGRLQGSSPADAIWEENPEALFVIEGTHVPYVESLNAGHSMQAPAGFIDMASEWAGQQLEAQAGAKLAEELKDI